MLTSHDADAWDVDEGDCDVGSWTRTRFLGTPRISGRSRPCGRALALLHDYYRRVLSQRTGYYRRDLAIKRTRRPWINFVMG
ncbi:hypothetical protein [Saccharopolyspora pogona]|uniref:hypothetical protein n=1 Tax=Saccharopolyspora pogona TaxID=333966 RepID=UPI001683C054|nr:hypothetical protein [Saccharopolyspora pogona]